MNSSAQGLCIAIHNAGLLTIVGVLGTQRGRLLPGSKQMSLAGQGFSILARKTDSAGVLDDLQQGSLCDPRLYVFF